MSARPWARGKALAESNPQPRGSGDVWHELWSEARAREVADACVAWLGSQGGGDDVSSAPELTRLAEALDELERHQAPLPAIFVDALFESVEEGAPGPGADLSLEPESVLACAEQICAEASESTWAQLALLLLAWAGAADGSPHDDDIRARIEASVRPLLRHASLVDHAVPALQILGPVGLELAVAAGGQHATAARASLGEFLLGAPGEVLEALDASDRRACERFVWTRVPVLDDDQANPDTTRALNIARFGQPAAALRDDPLDASLREGVARWLGVLLRGDEVADIDELAQGADLAAAFVEAVQRAREGDGHELSLSSLRAIAELADFVGGARDAELADEAAAAGIEADAAFMWAERAARGGWTPARREALQKETLQVLRDLGTPRAVTAALASNSSRAEFDAARAYLTQRWAMGFSPARGSAELFETLRRRLEAEPLWFELWAHAAALDLPATLELAAARVAALAPATGPSDAYGFGDEAAWDEVIVELAEAALDQVPSIADRRAAAAVWRAGLAGTYLNLRARLIEGLEGALDVGEAPRLRALELDEATLLDAAGRECDDELAATLRAIAAQV